MTLRTLLKVAALAVCVALLLLIAMLLLTPCHCAP